MSESLLPGLHLPETRKALAEVIIELLSQWKATPEEQAQLLGVEDVAPYHLGEPLPDAPMVLERAGLLLGVGRALSDYFDRPEMRAEWVRLPNPFLDERTPLAVMVQAPDGAARVRALLEAGRVR